MKAIVIRDFGGRDVLEARDLPVPEPGPGEVRVRVRATSVNPVDHKIREAGAWAGVEPPAVIGYDVAGVVDAVGPGVTEFSPGDEVYYTPEIFGGRPGSYAEYHVAHASIVARKPGNVTFEEAAALPLAGCTAWMAVHERLRVHAGETVLVHGGAGGVGHLAVQVAKALGARVLATASARNADFMRALGVDRAIDYASEDFERVVKDEEEAVDAAFDTVGGDLLNRTVNVVRPFGRVAGIVDVNGDFSVAVPKNVTIHPTFLTRSRHRLDALRTLVERGQVRVHVDEVRDLEDVGDAHARLETGHGRGKLVLRVP